MCFGQKKAPFAKLKNEEENGDYGLKKKKFSISNDVSGITKFGVDHTMRDVIVSNSFRGQKKKNFKAILSFSLTFLLVIMLLLGNFV